MPSGRGGEVSRAGVGLVQQLVEILAKTMEMLSDEGLVRVGVELLGMSLGLLGRW
jgi:hypothetical protein